MKSFEEFIVRDRDVVTGNADLEPLVDFPPMSIFMGPSNVAPEKDLTASMHWMISRSSGCIQLRNLIPLDILYSRAHGSGQVGATWLEHHKAFARFIAKYRPGKVLELGGGHGILSREYMNLAPAEWTIIEPNPTPAPGVTARYVSAIVDEHFTPDGEYDAFAHSHVMEHMYSPRQFIANVSRFMPKASYHFCTFPNMEAQLQHNYTNVLMFEHTWYVTRPYVERIFDAAGYELLDTSYFRADHSIFYAFRRRSTPPPIQLSLQKKGEVNDTEFSEYYEKNKLLFLKFVDYIYENVNNINILIDIAKKRRIPVYIFGGHIFTQILLAFGILEHNIDAILDNDKNKWGTRLSGTNLIIQSPQILVDIDKPYVIVKAGAYANEIKNGLLQINPNTKFIE